MFSFSIEMAFTAFFDLITKKELNLMGDTSLWMFPIFAFGLSYGIDLVKELFGTISFAIYPILFRFG